MADSPAAGRSPALMAMAWLKCRESRIRLTRGSAIPQRSEVERAFYQRLASCEPTPFVWKATADVILDEVRCCKELAGTGD